MSGSHRSLAMAAVIEAVYRDGVFRPAVPPDLPEGATVRLEIVSTIPAATVLTTEEREERTARIRAIIARSYRPGPPESTSENVDAILYGPNGAR
jgi:predicted DNA-binding antitoxin AbrB/MazE fold protein